MNVHTNSTSFAIPATVFQNSQFGSIRVAECHGEPWFVASDICSALDIRNPSSSLALLDDDEKGVHTMETLGGVQEMATVSEPGLYSLILRSRKREAKTFKRWITHDVIPTIRKHGMYATPQTIEAMLADPDTTIRILTELKTERERRIEAERTKAQISSRREATVMGKLSASAREVNRLRDELGASTRHATIKAVQKAIGKEFPRNGYVALRNWCKENGETAVDVPDSNYETVKAWPAEAWKAVYGIELAKIFKVATTVDGETLQ